MLRYIIVFLIPLFVGCKSLLAQADFYDISHIPEIRLYFAEANWDQILDEYFAAGENQRLMATLTIDGVELKKVGVRFKGFSSYSAGRKKNPFNIKLNYGIPGQRYQGFDKIKLSNVIQDPSFVREVLSYEIARKYMPASRANFANVYVNDTLIGLYSNVEAVNNEFTQTHFGSENNPLFKGNPKSLDLDGENSNLGNSPGTDSLAYEPYYELESTHGWADLYELIRMLNESPDSVEQVLNVDRTLWMHAFNYALINFDSYVGYAQNYYLYQDDQGRFNPILWDLNMSFGSFRFSDASLYWDGFSVDQAPEMDPLAHYSNVSVQPRPLLRKLFENDTWRRMYLAHMRTIMEENIATGEYAARGVILQALIDADVAADTNKFYSYANFTENLTDRVADLIEYPGITEMMEARLSYLSAYSGFAGAPEVENETEVSAGLSMGDPLTIKASVSGADRVLMAYRFSDQESFIQVSMQDDGTQNDGAPSDGLFGFVIPEIGNNLDYYFYAENDSAGQFLPERAAYEYYSISADIPEGALVINEFMASNSGIVADQNGEFEDWIELYNASGQPISTLGLYLSDDEETPLKWAFPSYIIQAGEYSTVWADGDTTQKGTHSNFSLDSRGGVLYMTQSNGNVIDSLSYSTQYPIISMGRIPNGSGPFTQMSPSYKAGNTLGSGGVFEDDFFVYPNPANDELNIIFQQPLPYFLEIISVDGRVLLNKTAITEAGLATLNTSDFASGLYYLRLSVDDLLSARKFIVLH